MRHAIAALLVLLLAAPAWAQEPPPEAPAAPTLSEVEQLRVEAHLLRLRVAQLEEQVATLRLSRERETLDAQIRAAHAGWRMDWTTGHLVAVEAAPTRSEGDEEP